MTDDARRLTTAIHDELGGLVERLRRDVSRVGDAPQAKALFEVAAEILVGLRTAFEHYQEGDEAAWREP